MKEMSETAPDTTRAGPGANLPELTVSELAQAVKRTMETNFDRVRVRGELGRVLIAKSGHLYVDLKDEDATISTVMWRSNVQALTFKPEEGLEVVVEGRLSTYPGRSQYQLIAERMAPAGVGALLAQLEKLKQKLAAEGLFAAERKKPIPYLPRVIGVVTSPTGAVIRDILHRLGERFPRRVLLWPVLVQGPEAAGQVARAIDGFPPDRIPRQTLAKGNYFVYAGKPVFTRLIYPAPVDGGLGTHVTLDMAGRMKFGPDVEWINREFYEVDPTRADSFYASIRRYFPALPDHSLVPDYSGIRPKLSGPGEAPVDFIIDGPEQHGCVRLVHLFGIESPGLTSSLSIAEDVAEMIER